ncbi:ABC transporter substrate-binding protein [Acetobacteraceae bacterium H6797]|nr:ABC transporter substrate-binding protein [Acetobacteraceae bacterium H6797]
MKIWLNADIRSLEPGINRDANTDTIVHQIYEGLVGFTRDLTVGPALADRWEVSADGLRWTFHLRDNAVFHNGAKLTSADVKAAWERQWNNPAWTCKRVFTQPGGLQVQSVEAPDPKTVVYTLKEPSALLLSWLASVQCGVVVAHEDSFGPDGKFRAPIGTGPWKLSDWRRAQRVVLQRFDGYGASAAPASGYSGAREVLLDQVTYMVIPDQSAAEAAIQSGAIDLMPNADVERVDALKATGLRVQSSPGLSWSTILIQTNDPVLKDVRVRQAIAHAIDLKQIAEIRTVGLAGPSPSPVSPSMSFYDESFAAWPAYDPAKAQALLRQAGYRGQVIKLQTNKRYSGMYDNSVAIQSMLSAVGFRVELEVLDWATQLSNYANGNFQLQSFSFSPRLDTGLAFTSIIGDKTQNPGAQWGSPEAIRLLSESGVISDEAKRADIFRRLHKMMAEEVPTIGLYFTPQVVASRQDIQGVTTWAAGWPVTWGIWRQR